MVTDLSFCHRLYQCVKVITQRLEDLNSSKFSIEEDSVVLRVEEPTHPDQNHLHGACTTRGRQEEKEPVQRRAREIRVNTGSVSVSDR